MGNRATLPAKCTFDMILEIGLGTGARLVTVVIDSDMRAHTHSSGHS